MSRRRIAGAKRYRAKGVWYCYDRETGRRVLSLYGSPAFYAEIAALRGEENLDTKQTKGNIYFILAGPYVKIGFATDVQKRLGELQVGNPEELILLHTEFGTRTSETKYHAKFSELRHHGEWFLHDGALVEFLNKKGSKIG